MTKLHEYLLTSEGKCAMIIDHDGRLSRCDQPLEAAVHRCSEPIATSGPAQCKHGHWLGSPQHPVATAGQVEVKIDPPRPGLETELFKTLDGVTIKGSPSMLEVLDAIRKVVTAHTASVAALVDALQRILKEAEFVGDAKEPFSTWVAEAARTAIAAATKE